MLAPRQHVEQMGRPFQLEEFEYVLTSIERHTTIGRGFHQREATEGATWVVVHYTIENTGKETENALTGDLTLKDTQGRTFQPSREGTTAVSLTKKVDIALTQLQPGLKKRQVAVFEVPTAVSKHFELVVPEKGLLGRKSRSFPFAWLSRRSA